MSWSRRLAAIVFVICLFAGGCAVAAQSSLVLSWIRKPYQLNTSRLDEWTAYGGAWDARQGTIHNNSDERGAKLVSGSAHWSDYTFGADIQFDADHGDMGLMIRSNREEEGVDAYDGYYVGLRTADGTLLVGRADYGWIEARPVVMPGGVHSGDWYHLSVTAVGCDIVARARNLRTGAVNGLRFAEYSCVRSGRIGLRSFSTGGRWRNLLVQPATRADYLAQAAGLAEVASPELPRGEADYNRDFHFATGDAPVPQPRPAESGPARAEVHIGDLQAIARTGRPLTTIRGVVTLTDPQLYVQDSTGGVVVRGDHLPAVNVGDAVEVRGRATSTLYSAVVQDITVRDLWSGTPLAPVSVTPLQASSGTYDNQFIEVEGHLLSAEHDAGLQVLNFGAGSQRFRAVYWSLPHKRIEELRPGSYVRLRGVCVLDPAYTREKVPFALLLRSLDDIQVLAGPPWWTPLHVGMLGAIVLALALVAQLLYYRVKHWQALTITQERERIAHDLHDTMAQSFAGVGYQIQGIRSRVVRNGSDDAAEIAEQLGVAYQLVRHCHEEASRTIAMMASSRSDELENHLLDQLRKVAEEIAGDQVRTRTELDGSVQPLKPRLANALFHIGQEAISNSLAHAKPTEVCIRLSFQERNLTLTVTDNGQGFDMGTEPSGFGILGMQKRVREINAEVVITSAPEGGTTVRVKAPLSRHSPIAERVVMWARMMSQQLGFGSS